MIKLSQKQIGVMVVVRRTEDERRLLIEEYRRSGKPKMAWCRENSVPYTTFANWTKSVLAEKESESVLSTQWVEVTPVPEVMTEGRSESAVEPSAMVCLMRGDFEIRVEAGFDSEHLANVLRVVNRVCC